MRSILPPLLDSSKCTPSLICRSGEELAKPTKTSLNRRTSGEYHHCRVVRMHNKAGSPHQKRGCNSERVNGPLFRKSSLLLSGNKLKKVMDRDGSDFAVFGESNAKAWGLDGRVRLLGAGREFTRGRRKPKRHIFSMRRSNRI